MARGFAAEGASVVLAARSVDDLERVRKECEVAGAAAANVVPTDITDPTQVHDLVAGAIDTFGRIDCFVANAGTSYGMLTDKRYRELFTYDLEIVEQVLRVNTIGTWLCMKEALPVMQPGASFVIVGSETGRMASAGSGIYAVSKVTNDTLTLIAAKEMEERGVRVNRLTPGGMVDTQLFGPAGMSDQLKQHVPWSDTDVIVPAAVWLASDDSADVNGCFVVAKDFNGRSIEETKAALAAAPA
jgi:3-oxoacyl-[acyl-carrier protein] reductase